MRIAQEDIFQYMINPEWQSPEWPEGYWPALDADLSDEKWNKTYNGFMQDFIKIIDLVLLVLLAFL